MLSSARGPVLKTCLARFASSSSSGGSIRTGPGGIHYEDANHTLPFKGEPASKKPVKVELEAGKTYSWCACGISRNQPWCDGSHKKYGFTNCKPVTFTAAKSGSKMMCMCKQNKEESRPFCDGTHKVIDQTPVELDPNRYKFVYFTQSPVYDGTAKKLGYKNKQGKPISGVGNMPIDYSRYH